MASSPTTFTGDITALVAAPGVKPQIDALVAGSKWGTGPAGTAASLTFSFPATVAAFDTRAGIPGNYNPSEPLGEGFAAKLTNFSAFSAEQQEAARQVLQAFANVANLSFTEVAADTVDAGVLRFANTAAPGLSATSWGESHWPQDFAGAGDTWMNSVFLFPEGWARGTQNFLTLLHEVGHALGLKHPHDTGPSGTYTGWPQNTTVLPTTDGGTTLANESTQSMVMAYNDIPGISVLNGLALQSDFAPTTPMRWDIAALQFLYGANMTYNAGDTIYTFAGNARYNQTIWDAGGNDTIVATGTQAVEIDLRPAQWSKLGQPMTFSTRDSVNAVVAAQPQFNDAYTVFLYDTVAIENAVGGGGNDGLIGNDFGNWLLGGAGNDILLGLLGFDFAQYLGNLGSYLIGRNGATITVSGPDGADSLTGIERAQFADLALAFDIDGNAGQAYRLYQAAFARQPDLDGLSFWIGQMDLGAALSTVAGQFIGSAEFVAKYGTNPTNEQFVTLLYQNVLNRLPDAGGLAFWVNQLNAGTITRPEVLIGFSESTENKANVLPAIDNGITYRAGSIVVGSPAGDSLRGTGSPDSLSGADGRDVLAGLGGNDRIDGGADLDVSVYRGARSLYTATLNGTDLAVTDSTGLDGADLLSLVERLQFSDLNLAFDIGGTAGQTYRLYQAAFARTPDIGGLSFWISQMDKGAALPQVSAAFIGSAEFVSKYGANPSNGDFVTLLYQNVLGRAPDAGGLAFWVNQLDGGTITRPDTLIGFSESTENQMALIGVLQQGIEYLPLG